MSYVQFFGSFEDVETKYPSVQLWADGDGKVFFEENGERQYLEHGDYVVLQGNKHVVTKQKPEEEKPKAKEDDKKEDK